MQDLHQSTSWMMLTLIIFQLVLSYDLLEDRRGLVRNAESVDVNFQAPRVFRNYRSNYSSLWIVLHYLEKEKSVQFHQSV